VELGGVATPVEGIYYFTNSQKDDNDYNNYRGISLLSTAYKILYNILLARLIRHVNEDTNDHRCVPS
jgi:hypothetical protein